LTRQTKRVPHSPKVFLNRDAPKLERGMLDMLQLNASKADALFTVTELECVLMMTAGIRLFASDNAQVKRCSATGGNLGSVELFVAVRNVDGVSPGLYFYEAQEHALAAFQLRSGSPSIETLMRRVVPDCRDDLPEALIFLTAAFHRVAQKYSAFGYRLINLDAGVALSQLHVVARSLNLMPVTAVSWPDDLMEEQLGLQQIEEQCTAVVALSRNATTSRPATKLIGKVRRSGMKPVREFADLPIEAVGRMLFHESRMQEAGLEQGVSRDFAAPAEPLIGHGAPLPLPVPARGGRIVGEILASRASVRHYTPDRISADQLGTMLSIAQRSDVSDWPEEHALGLDLVFMAIVSRAERIPAGVYRYDTQDHALRSCRNALSPSQITGLFLQDEFTTAPLVIWITGNLAGACARHGAFGHRQLLLRAGSAGHRLWMAALGMGLQGCLVSGLVPGEVRRTLGIDGYRCASLLAFVAGHGVPFR
jgi:SagB-type dehydrogenase family enzyme